MIRQGTREDEHGFTLIEVLATIIVMGIVFAIASSTWFGVVESRRVDSATNQVAADLRLAHTRAKNRLENWKLDLRPPGDPSTDYRIGSCVDPCVVPLSLSLEEGSEFPAGMSGGVVVFKPTGEADIIGLVGNIQVAADDGSPCHEIEVNSVTSRVELLPNAC